MKFERTNIEVPVYKTGTTLLIIHVLALQSALTARKYTNDFTPRRPFERLCSIKQQLCFGLKVNADGNSTLQRQTDAMIDAINLLASLNRKHSGFIKGAYYFNPDRKGERIRALLARSMRNGFWIT